MGLSVCGLLHYMLKETMIQELSVNILKWSHRHTQTIIKMKLITSMADAHICKTKNAQPLQVNTT